MRDFGEGLVGHASMRLAFFPGLDVLVEKASCGRPLGLGDGAWSRRRLVDPAQRQIGTNKGRMAPFPSSPTTRSLRG